jgi:hypothetical protein
MKDKYFLAIMGVTGLLIGIGAVQLIDNNSTNTQDNYCSRVGDTLEKNGSFNGSVNCYPPGVLNVGSNVTEDVENQTNLQCVCRNTFEDREHIFSIRRTR